MAARGISRYQSNTAKQCLNTILEIQPKDSSSGGGETREIIVHRQAREMLEELPADYIPHEARPRNKHKPFMSPLSLSRCMLGCRRWVPLLP